MKTARIILLISLVGLTACGKSLDDFVREARPNPGVLPTPIPSKGSAQSYVKQSPGSIRAVGSAVSMKATITPTETRLTGTNINAEIGIQKSR